MRGTRLTSLGLVSLVLAGCNTYYDPSDNYVRGLRWFDRGNYGLARENWEPLANAGDCDAQARLGYLLYAQARPGPEQEAAARLLRTAAERGQPFGQFWYGTLFFPETIKVPGMDIKTECSGCGVTKDPETAYVWIALARRNSVYKQFSAMTEEALPQVRATLTPAQAADADQRVAAWQPVGPLCRPRQLL